MVLRGCCCVLKDGRGVVGICKCYHAGPWTVGTFLQKHAGRADILTLDRHTRAAMRALFAKQLQILETGHDEDSAMEVLAKRLWSPHRTLAR